MTNQSPESVIAEALRRTTTPLSEPLWSEVRAEQARYIEAALRAANMLREPGDAATAALERARVIHVRDTPSIGGDWCLDDHHKWPCPTVAALDGAPEPEVKP